MVMKKISEYAEVYGNWYCKSCEKSNEIPVSFNTYIKIVPVHEMKELKSLLADGKTP